jgi:hypothetical protein
MDWRLFLIGCGGVWVGGSWIVITTGTLRRRRHAQAHREPGTRTETVIERIARAMEGWIPGMDLVSDNYVRFQRAMSYGLVTIGVLLMLVAIAGGTAEEL